jgi:hypothetical protein
MWCSNSEGLGSRGSYLIGWRRGAGSQNGLGLWGDGELRKGKKPILRRLQAPAPSVDGLIHSSRVLELEMHDRRRFSRHQDIR